jgi:PAS domain S-box-containing protein
MLTDAAGNIEYVNDRLARLTGYTLDELRGENPRLFKADRMPLDNYKELWANITAGLTWQGEFCNRKKDGSYYWEAALISPQQDEQGRIVGFIKVAHDISAYKQREEELLARLAALEQRPAHNQE